jgi:hypothetical protein
MTFEKDSLIYLNLTSIVKETNELIETTLEEKAKEHNVYDPTKKYTGRNWRGMGARGIRQQIKRNVCR